MNETTSSDQLSPEVDPLFAEHLPAIPEITVSTNENGFVSITQEVPYRSLDVVKIHPRDAALVAEWIVAAAKAIKERDVAK